jgi:hypothetical protein
MLGREVPRRPKISDLPEQDDFARNDMLTPLFSALLV